VRPARAIVFDLDGTLADTRLDIAAACNHALVALGRAPQSVDAIVGFVGDGSRTLVARAFELPTDDPVVREAFEIFSTFYAEHAADHSSWMPGARDALEACAHLPLALATNKPRSATLPLLEALGVTHRFRAVVAGGDGPLKPDPAAIRAALAPLGVAPEDAWVVGDGPQDIGAGRAAGTWTVGVLGGFASDSALRNARPDRILPSLSHLAALLHEVATGMGSRPA
jgi:phosphoglycolate phosphatase